MTRSPKAEDLARVSGAPDIDEPDEAEEFLDFEIPPPQGTTDPVSGRQSGDGWVLVPREPTDAMHDAYYALIPYAPGTESFAMARYPLFSAVWFDVIAAAPPATRGEG